MIIGIHAKNIREAPKELIGKNEVGACHYPSEIYELISSLKFLGTYILKKDLDELHEPFLFNDIEEKAMIIFENNGAFFPLEFPFVQIEDLSHYILLSDKCCEVIEAGLCVRGVCCRGVYEWASKKEVFEIKKMLNLRENDFVQYWDGKYASLKHPKGTCVLLDENGFCKIQKCKNLWCSYFVCPKIIQLLRSRK